MNKLLQKLQPYPFERLRQLMQETRAPEHLTPILLHIGEPKHATPKIITDTLIKHIDRMASYPATAGLSALREACSHWLLSRYQVKASPDTQILPICGSREALFSFVQSALNPTKDNPNPIVVSPNPFYQIYEGATLLAGGEPYYVNCDAPLFMPDYQSIPNEIWARTQIVFICSPGNPTGAVMKLFDYQQLFALQDRYDFIIAADECYSEIYFEAPPMGILEAAQRLGRSFEKIVMFTSLSKRSNVPGLRSGFVAGDEKILKDFLRYRTYHGSAMSEPSQYASIAAWGDETHVAENRALYQQKFDAVLPILQKKFEVNAPEASFYLWLKVPDGDDTGFTQKLWQEQAVQVLPGSYLSRDTEKGNAGKGYVRIALVAPLDECVAAAKRMVEI